MRVGHDHAGVDRKSFAANQSLAQAACDHGLEQLAQKIALAEPAVAVLKTATRNAEQRHGLRLSASAKN